MAKNLVIVESPAKAKTIEGYLGKDFLVTSSYGHIRDLEKKNKGVEIENDFKEAYSGIQKLPNEAKFGVYTAYIYYMKLLQKLKKANAREIREERIRINNPTKIKLLVSSYVNYKLKLI